MIGFVGHESSRLHETPPGHPERADRIAAITDHLDATGLTSELVGHAPSVASRDVLALVHDGVHLDALERLDAAGGGRIDADTSMGRHSLEAALRGTQGAVDATDKVLRGEWDGAFVCTRPPGHHATPLRSMGFCLTNHVAVAARWAVATGRASRVAVFDWDAHHGNGTQDAFWTDPSVLYVSLHQYPWYPGTGDATERGEDAGEGSTINVPLPAGAGEDAYDRAIDRIVEPAFHEFRPDLVYVSAGFDAHHRDPLCMMRLSAGAFFRMAARVSQWGAGPVCVLEGGYDLEALAWSAAATVSALTRSDEPVGLPADEIGAHSGHPDACAWVDRAAALLRTA